MSGSYFGVGVTSAYCRPHFLAIVLFPHMNSIRCVFPTVLNSHIYYSSLRRDDSSESSNDGSETAYMTMGAPDKKTTNLKTTSIAIQTCNQSAISSGAINQVVDEKLTESESVNDGNQLEAPGHKNHKSAEENKSDVNRKKQLQKITEELYNEMVADDLDNLEKVRNNAHEKIAKSIRKTKDMVSQDLNQNIITSKTKEVSHF